jgi:hypothetical protein
MLSSSRTLRHSVLPLLWIVTSACFAQTNPQFSQPKIEATSGRVTSFLVGGFEPSTTDDILYINAAVNVGGASQVTAGELLNQPSDINLIQNQIVFPNVLAATAALSDLNGDGHLDYAFALSPATAAGNDLCVYYGTGLGIAGSGSYALDQSGCMSFPIQGSLTPAFTTIVAAPFRANGKLPQLILEDSANRYLYIVTNSGFTGGSGQLLGIALKLQIPIPASGCPGPIYTGDFNNDGNTDFIVNGQTCTNLQTGNPQSDNSASIYFGNGDGTFQAPVRLTFDHNVHSMLLQDMDNDGIADMVVEGDNGVIEIFHGNNTTANTFSSASEGGTLPGLNGFSGNGGHLAAIAKLGGDTNLDILTTTPIGLSVLQGQGNLTYALKGIYNIGPGRTSLALAQFNGDGNLDLAVDSPEGVAIVQGNADGSFQTSLAFSALQPGLNATVGVYRNSQNNPSHHLDVAVATGATQAQLLTGNGDGTFNTFATPTNSTPITGVPAGVWSNIFAGDFDGDGNLDILYSLTGLLSPGPSGPSFPILYTQYGNGDGTFTQSGFAFVTPGTAGSNNDGWYGESAVADFNGDGLSDVGFSDEYFDGTVLGKAGARNAYTGGFSLADSANATFNQVAAGFFKVNRTNKQDLIFQAGANLVPYLNSGSGASFTAMPALANPPPAASFAAPTVLFTDIDGDGFGDVIVPFHNLAANPANPSSSAPNQLYIWYGHGDGTFGSPQIVPLCRNYYLAAAGDMNADGLPDLVLSDGYLVAILYNQGNRSFGTVSNGCVVDDNHFLAGQGINSLSIVDLVGDGSPDLVVANGGATISNAIAIGGRTLSSLSLTPNPDVNSGGITVLLNKITTKPVTGALTSTPNPSAYQAAFTMTATLSPSPGVSAPTGTVQFTVDGNPVGSPVYLTAGTATSTASYSVPAGNTYANGVQHPLTAIYSGDLVNSPITLYATQTVSGVPTTTTLDLCIGPTPACPSNGGINPPPPFMATLTMYYGQTFNGSAQTDANDGSTLTGTIAFNDLYNGVSTTLCTLLAGAAGSCPPSVGVTQGTSVGVNVFTAVYSGDSTHAPSSSPTVTITVLQDSNTATLTGAPNPSPFGQPVTFTTTFTGNFAPPTGTVTFAELFPPTASAVQLGTATLVPSPTGNTSTATFTTSALPIGTDTISVSYAVTQDFAAAIATTTEVILPLATTTTTLSSSVNPSAIGQSVTFTATVTAAASGGTAAPTPTGTVTFLDGTTTLGTGTLSASGVATFTTLTLAVGSHNITASYPGNTATNPSTSSVLVQVVTNSSFTLSVTPSPITVGVGDATTLTITITPVAGFNQNVNLSCSGLPTESACTFGTTTLAPGSYTTTLLLSTAAPHSCGTTQPYFLGRSGSGPNPVSGLAPFAMPALAGLAFLFLPGRRRWLRALIAIAAIAGAMQLTACGNCTDLGTRPGTYTFQITAAASGTSEVESQSVTVTVTI